MLKIKDNFISVIIMTILITLSVFTNPAFGAESIDNDDYQTFIIKDQNFAVYFDNQTDCAELIMPDGNKEILARQISASGAKYGNEKITFWNKGERSQISIRDKIIFDAELVEADSELKNKFTEQNNKKRVFFKSRGFYVMLQKKDKNAEIVLDGREFTLEKKTEKDHSSIYSSEEMQISEQNSSLLIKVEDYQFYAEKVNLNDYLSDEELKLRGLGQEPGWLMTIKEDEIELELDYAQVKINIKPANFKLIKGNEEIKYEIMTSLINFKIYIIESPHRDIMSGRILPYTVRIKAGDRELIGGAYISN
ncbi:MAG: MliC family protein [Halanaerobium sp.]